MWKKDFVSDWVTQVAQIYFNDKWYRATVLQTYNYIETANQELDHIFDPDARKKLQNIISEVSQDCIYIIAFCDEVEKFRKKKVRWITQKFTKNLVIIRSIHHLSLVHDKMRRYLIHFHCELSEIINWKKEPF